MKRIFFLICAILLLTLHIHAQELTVKSMTVATNDISARTTDTKRYDGNREACGLIKVQLPLQGVTFEGTVIGEVANKSGEYWVYMNDGARQLRIKHPNYYPLEIYFSNYGIRKIDSLTTYKLVIGMPQGQITQSDDGMSYLALRVTPANSHVLIDGKEKTISSEGTANILLSQGTHHYEVSATGYANEQGTVVIGPEKLRKDITLQSVLAQVTVSCATPGAKIYVNDQLKGSSPWSGQLLADNYLFEARLDGYHSGRAKESIVERANREIVIPALTAITGSLDVNYTPMDAEVWMDGKKLGTSPDVFRGIIIGSHEVEIRKDGYQSKKEPVTISEGQTASLSGELKGFASNSGFASTSFDSNVETITVKGVSFKMVRVVGGTFTMGASGPGNGGADNWCRPAHRVTLSTYYIGETELTQALWEAVMGSNPFKWKGSNLPVDSVSWDDCQEFIRRLNQSTGKSFRLPTEAEWEYAARGGQYSKGYMYSGSNIIDDVAWYIGNSGDRPSSFNQKEKDNCRIHEVGLKEKNELGLYDMCGNVCEWCSDYYGDYISSPQTNPKNTTPHFTHVSRGGRWTDNSWSCTVWNRGPGRPVTGVGLRLAL